MDFMKKTLLTSCILAMTSTSFAGGVTTPPEGMGDLQWGGSLLVDHGFGTGIGIDVQNQKIEAGANFGGGNINPANIPSFSEFYYGFYAGLRHELRGNVYGALGALAVFEQYYGTTPVALINRSPYKVGAYLGLEYQPNQSFQGFVRVMPYSYIKGNTNTRVNSYFKESQVGIKYFFN
jgi:hypothetical protein